MTKCLLCTALTETGQEFYDHLEDVHMMPIRRERIVQPENWIHGMSLEKKGLIADGNPVREETQDECMERFKFNHPEYGTDQCWCPDCIGGETLAMVNKVCEIHDRSTTQLFVFGQLYIKGKHGN